MTHLRLGCNSVVGPTLAMPNRSPAAETSEESLGWRAGGVEKAGYVGLKSEGRSYGGVTNLGNCFVLIEQERWPTQVNK